MSQFVFGEILISSNTINLEQCGSDLVHFPFSIRFNMRPNDYYRRISPTRQSIIPFVIADSINDNTAELLFQTSSEYLFTTNFPHCYDRILSLSLSNRIALVVEALKNMMNQFQSSECILVFCDGIEMPTKYIDSDIDSLAEKINEVLDREPFFAVAAYRIRL